jgi:hypothetical protein
MRHGTYSSRPKSTCGSGHLRQLNAIIAAHAAAISA